MRSSCVPHGRALHRVPSPSAALPGAAVTHLRAVPSCRGATTDLRIRAPERVGPRLRPDSAVPCGDRPCSVGRSVSILGDPPTGVKKKSGTDSVTLRPIALPVSLDRMRHGYGPLTPKATRIRRACSTPRRLAGVGGHAHGGQHAGRSGRRRHGPPSRSAVATRRGTRCSPTGTCRSGARSVRGPNRTPRRPRPAIEALEEQVRTLCRPSVRDRSPIAAFRCSCVDRAVRVSPVPDDTALADPGPLAPVPDTLRLPVVHGPASDGCAGTRRPLGRAR